MDKINYTHIKALIDKCNELLSEQGKTDSLEITTSKNRLGITRKKADGNDITLVVDDTPTRTLYWAHGFLDSLSF